MKNPIDHKECWNELSVWLNRSINHFAEMRKEQNLDDNEKVRLRQKEISYKNTMQKMRELESIFSE